MNRKIIFFRVITSGVFVFLCLSAFPLGVSAAAAAAAEAAARKAEAERAVSLARIHKIGLFLWCGIGKYKTLSKPLRKSFKVIAEGDFLGGSP